MINTVFVCLSSVHPSACLCSYLDLLHVCPSVPPCVIHSFCLTISQFGYTGRLFLQVSCNETFSPNYKYRGELVNIKKVIPSIPPLGWVTPEVCVYTRDNVALASQQQKYPWRKSKALCLQAFSTAWRWFLHIQRFLSNTFHSCGRKTPSWH